MSGLNGLFVGAGAFIGAVARWQCSTWINAQYWPYGTWAVNTMGCVFIGVLAGVFKLHPMPAGLSLFLVTGLFGGFTTFSTFSLETLQLLQHGGAVRAVVYITVTFAACLGGCAVGYCSSLKVLS